MHSDDYNAYCAEIDLCTDILRIEYLLEHARMLQKDAMKGWDRANEYVPRDFDVKPGMLINFATRRLSDLRLSAVLGNPEGWTFGGDPDG